MDGFNSLSWGCFFKRSAVVNSLEMSLLSSASSWSLILTWIKSCFQNELHKLPEVPLELRTFQTIGGSLINHCTYFLGCFALFLNSNYADYLDEFWTLCFANPIWRRRLLASLVTSRKTEFEKYFFKIFLQTY